MIKGLNKNVATTQYPGQIKYLKETLWKSIMDDTFSRYIDENMAVL